GRGHRPGPGRGAPVDPGGVQGGGACPAAGGHLDDEGAEAERGNDAVADEEPRPLRRGTWRVLADDVAVGGQPVVERAVRLRVGDVDTAGEHRDGVATDGE